MVVGVVEEEEEGLMGGMMAAAAAATTAAAAAVVVVSVVGCLQVHSHQSVRARDGCCCYGACAHTHMLLLPMLLVCV